MVAGLALLAAGTSAQAALLSRAGGQAVYDTDLDLTWVADANLAQTSGYDSEGVRGTCTSAQATNTPSARPSPTATRGL